ncbi:FecR domain-containing protein [Pedobacter sp. FW305-3-2-15-E-R2A2]|uniref:FecR family protein n=1 Tax=Pedobacter sp. FW305-3-2-15-E-R2A2 TaxID=3140251 RepID=UPI00313FFD7B
MLKHLDGVNEDGEAPGTLNEEELEMLLLAEEMRIKLKGMDPEAQFPVEEGWKELQYAHEQSKRKEPLLISWYKRHQWLSIAATMALLLAPVFWWYATDKTEKGISNPVAKQVPSNQIRLTLGNGKSINIEEQSGALKGAEEHLALTGSAIVYEKEGAAKENLAGNNTLEVPFGKQTKVVLSDGTQIWINAGSKLTYPSQFGAAKREVSLEGEAFFDVVHQAQRPFVVHTGRLSINVLGTEFNVNTFGASFQTALVRGKVRLEAGTKSMVLLPGELGTYHDQSAGLSKKESNLREYTAWKDKELYFDNGRLGDIASRLEREYDLSFSFESPELKNLHFTIDMPRPDEVQGVLNNIRLSTNQINFVFKGKQIEVKKR